MLVSGNNGYKLWGMRIMEEFFSNGTVALSDIFPVVTMCDVDIRTMGKSVLSHNKRICLHVQCCCQVHSWLLKYVKTVQTMPVTIGLHVHA